MFNGPKGETQLDTVGAATAYTVTSDGDCDEHVARTINESTMQITANHDECADKVAIFEALSVKIWKWSQIHISSFIFILYFSLDS